MLTARIIRTWLKLREQAADNDHVMSALARGNPEIAEAWERSELIDDLIGSARIVKHGLASKAFTDAFHERLRRETANPDAAQAILDAA
jgi:hypothetical protein